VRRLGSRSGAFRLLSVLLALAAVAPACGRQERGPLTATDFVGDQECLACHPDRASYLTTAHHLTSTLPARNTIAGTFAEGEQILNTSNPYLRFRMYSTPDGFFQSAIMGRAPATTVRSERFDIVIGSGRKGQTYLYWRDDRLFQLPISYWTGLNSWVNSPGYRDGVANFSRPIAPRCLECHATFFESRADTALNRYDPSNFVLSISCERCHGPGREHGDRRRSWASRLRGAAIVNPAELPRNRAIDVCALCHSGVGEQKAPPFSYIPGEPLDDYLVPAPLPPGEDVDVHGNQTALLARSRCFQTSTTMTCSTCHDVHAPQRSTAEFVPRCLECHSVESCGLFPARGAAISKGCVDCHMPELTSQTVVSTHEGKRVQPRIRSHWIKVYPDGG
jgi:hypothetical protein